MMTVVKKIPWKDLAWVAAFILIAFTPVGTPVKIMVNRLISFSPSVEAAEDRVVLQDYSWELTDALGERANLSDYRGQVVLINFWASWCPPCIAEMPALQRLYEAWGDKVVFLFVSVETPDKAAEFLRKKEMELPVFFAREEAPEAIRSNSLPTTYLIDKAGNILIDKTGAARWDSENMHELLGELTR